MHAHDLQPKQQRPCKSHTLGDISTFICLLCYLFELVYFVFSLSEIECCSSLNFTLSSSLNFTLLMQKLSAVHGPNVSLL